MLNFFFKKNKRIYFDSASASKPSKEVLQITNSALKNIFANPSSIHFEGEIAKEALQKARKKVAEFIKAKPNEIIFCASTTESNNIFIQGFLKNFANNKILPHVLIPLSEHSALLDIVKNLEAEEKIEATYLIPKENGLLDLENLASFVKENTALFITSYIHSETGIKQDIKKITEILNKKNSNIKLFLDATQALQFETVDTNFLGVAGMSFGGHKIGAISGSAALYIQKGINIKPIFFGGGQESGIRSGSENLPAILSLEQSLKEIFEQKKETKQKNKNHISSLKKYLIDKIENEINQNLEFSDSKKVVIFGDTKAKHLNLDGNSIYVFENSSPHIILMWVKNIFSEEVLLRLDARGISVSSATACSLIENSGSQFLKSLGKNKESKETIRISFCKENTKKEIDFFVKVLKEIIQKYQK